MFSEELDPSWWDLAWCTTRDYPEGEIVFLPEEGDSSDSDPILDKFAPDSSESSSSDFDGDANLGGCSGPHVLAFICSLLTRLMSPQNLGLLKLTKKCLRP